MPERIFRHKEMVIIQFYSASKPALLQGITKIINLAGVVVKTQFRHQMPFTNKSSNATNRSVM